MRVALGAAVAVAGWANTAHSQPQKLKPSELDQIQKAFPQSTVPKEFYKRGKGPHGSGDPHAKLGPGKLVTVALQHLAEGRRDDAMRTLNSGIASYPKNPELRGVRGSIYLQHKEFAKALSDFEAAVAERPDDALLLVNRAQGYRSFNRLDEALADLNKAIELKPDLVAARFNRGALYVNMRKLEEAKADFEHCIAVDPHVAAPRFNLAIALDGLGQREEAVKEMERFLKVAKQESWKKVAREQLDVWKKADDTATAEVKKSAVPKSQDDAAKSN